MNLAEIGAFLRAEREKRQLSLNDVAARLKINPRLLAALEAGNEAALPHQAYVRGFIRSYAGLLGIGAEETQALLEGVVPVDARALAGTPEGVEMPEPQERSRSGGTSAAVLVFFCALLGALYWAWHSGALDFLEMKKDRPVTLEERLPPADAYLAARAEKRLQKENHQTEEPATPVPVPQPAPPVPEVAEPAPALPEPEPEPTPPAKEEDVVAPAQHKLIITATEECWVHSNADKTDTRQFSLRKGDTFALTFAKSLELKLGNAGGVRLRYDGSDLPPPGTSGQVKTIVFPPASNSD